MSWRAAHEGPDKFLARSEHHSWGYAQRWLLEMMCLTNPKGIDQAFWALTRAVPDCGCLFEVGEHTYALIADASVEFMEVAHAA